MNSVVLLGNVGKDPELKAVKSTHVCKFSVATSKKSNREGDSKDYTTWHNIVVWGKQAEACAQYLQKGSKVVVEGEIENRSYDDKDGNKRYITEIVAYKVHFVSKKEGEPNGDFPRVTKSNNIDQFDDVPF